jgi:hypothetical protein
LAKKNEMSQNPTDAEKKKKKNLPSSPKRRKK